LRSRLLQLEQNEAVLFHRCRRKKCTWRTFYEWYACSSSLLQHSSWNSGQLLQTIDFYDVLVWFLWKFIRSID